MKHFYFLLVCLFAFINVYAQDKVVMDSQANDCLSSKVTGARQDTVEGLITRQITVKLDRAGTLFTKIGSERGYKITNLKIVGEINGLDVGYIQGLAGKLEDNESYYLHEPNLSVLDLSETKIVEITKAEEKYCDSISGGHWYRTNNDIIGDYFFAKCTKLKSVILPNDVISIGQNAFGECSSLTSISIPAGVTSIGSAAFADCRSLTSITIPSSVTSIGIAAFLCCRSLTSISIPYGVSKIDDHTFDGCSNLVSISLPDGLTSIGVCAFWGCYSLVNVILPNSICWLDEGAFSSCYNLVNITLPNNLLGLNDAVFYDCKSLINLTIPSSVSTIGDSAFGGCSSLANIYLGWKNPVPITGNVFADVDTKTCKVYIPKGTYDDYFISNWGEFDNLIEYDVTGIDHASTMKKAKELMRYSINGQRFNHQSKGLNIVKYSDGSVRKEIVK